jgi:hypothetical protein
MPYIKTNQNLVETIKFETANPLETLFSLITKNHNFFFFVQSQNFGVCVET